MKTALLVLPSSSSSSSSPSSSTSWVKFKQFIWRIIHPLLGSFAINDNLVRVGFRSRKKYRTGRSSFTWFALRDVGQRLIDQWQSGSAVTPTTYCYHTPKKLVWLELFTKTTKAKVTGLKSFMLKTNSFCFYAGSTESGENGNGHQIRMIPMFY